MRFTLSALAVLVLLVAPSGARAQSFEGLDLTEPEVKKPRVKARPTELLVQLGKPLAGAKLFIDDAEVGELPLESRPVTPGAHRLKVVRLGYRTLTQQVTALKGKKNAVTVELAPEGAVLTVQSSEAGAECSVDGALSASLPLTVVLTPGKHMLRISKEGFTDETQEVLAELGVDRTVTAELRPALVADRPAISTVILDPSEPDPDLMTERGGAREVRADGPPGPAWYKRWYVWAGVGVLAAGVTATVVATQPRPVPLDANTVCGGPCDVIIGM
ncbi:MAG: PEGA domain-containing protein [Myxococcaceae bacterium]